MPRPLTAPAALAVALLALAAPAPRAQAPVPTTISYQGVLTDANGNPVPNGTYAVTLRLFTAASGGSADYAENHTVTTSGGVFSAELGAGTPVTGGWSSIRFDRGYWLETAVGGTTFAPRTKLLAVPYARALTYPSVSIVSTSGYTLDIENTAGSALLITSSAPSGERAAVRASSFSSQGRTIHAEAHATSGPATGVYGRTFSSSGYGVHGLGDGVGVFGETGSGRGVFGRATASIGTAYGVYGEAASTSGRGVYGAATAATGTNYGVFGTTASTSGRAVYGSATAATGTNYGVFGTTGSSSGYAGYFNGRAHVTGTLSKGGGSFVIDHPLDPERRLLRHSFVESPDMMNVYNGNTVLDRSGEAVVVLPAWFEALNRDFRYQLTPLGAPMPNLYVADRIAGNRFRIAGGVPGAEVSWQVTGVRHDAWAEENRIVVEEDKEPAQRGRYLHPSAFGQPRERGVDYDSELEAEQARLDEERAREAPRP